MLVLVGNSPSSGSTLLSELLDSTRVSISGEELGLFASKKFYCDLKNSVSELSTSKSIYVSRNGLFKKGLASYGTSENDLKSLSIKASDQAGFVEEFVELFSKFRGKRCDIVFEKTPQNLTCIGEFLDCFKSSYFIHIVRNPLHVYASLLNRGFPPYIALSTWLIDVASFYKYKDHERVISLKYENLVADPFGIVKDVISKIISVDLSKEEIEADYKENTYRKKYTLKIKSWGQQEHGKIQSSNKKSLPKELSESFNASTGMEVTEAYAFKFGIAKCTYQELMEYFGYTNSIDISDSRRIKKSARDLKILSSKFYHDWRGGDAKLSELGLYLNPTVYT